MNVLEKLNSNTKNLDLNYYGVGDMSTGIKIKELLDNQTFILNYYKTNTIENINDYIDYLFISTIIKFEEVLPYVKKQKHNEFETFLNKCKSVYNKYEIKDVILFLKKNYISVYTYEDSETNNEGTLYLEYELKTYTSNIIGKHFNSFEMKVFDYLITNQTYYIIDNFSVWKSFFTKNPAHFGILFNEDNIKKLFYMRLEEMLEIIFSFKSNTNFTKSIEKITNLILKVVKETYLINEDNIIQNYYILHDVTLFFKKIKSPHAYELEKLYYNQEKQLENEIIKKGQSFNYKLDLSPFKVFWDDKNISWQSKFLSISHSKDETGKVASFLEKGAKLNSQALSDHIARRNPNEDDYFTSWRLRNIEFHSFHTQSVLLFILNEEKNINNLFSYLIHTLEKICLHIDTTLELERLDNDLEMLAQMLMDLFVNFNKGFPEVTIKNNIFGGAVLICGLIEKILRLIYKFSIRETIYIPDSQISLAQLLNPNQKSIILEILGFEQTYCLKYYLTKTDNKIGINARNDLMHLNGNTLERLNYNLYLELFSYLISVINSSYLFFHKK